VLHGIDLGSEYSLTLPLTSQQNLLDHVVLMNEDYLAAGHLLEELRMDDQFVTAEITSWCKIRQIAVSQPAPTV
jgi:hypothetical protein